MINYVVGRISLHFIYTCVWLWYTRWHNERRQTSYNKFVTKSNKKKQTNKQIDFVISRTFCTKKINDLAINNEFIKKKKLNEKKHQTNLWNWTVTDWNVKLRRIFDIRLILKNCDIFAKTVTWGIRLNFCIGMPLWLMYIFTVNAKNNVIHQSPQFSKNKNIKNL